MSASPWCLTWAASPAGRALADQHYSRQHPGAALFTPPGRRFVLLCEDRRAVWSTRWPKFAQHAWAGAWENTLFRRDANCQHRASDLIRWAVAHSQAYWPDTPPPATGIVTFIDAGKIQPKTGRYRTPGVGWCYLKAGWQAAGFTEGGLHVFQQLPGDMPEPELVTGSQMSLFGGAA